MKTFVLSATGFCIWLVLLVILGTAVLAARLIVLIEDTVRTWRRI